jgi:hypothetical protein
MKRAKRLSGKIAINGTRTVILLIIWNLMTLYAVMGALDLIGENYKTNYLNSHYVDSQSVDLHCVDSHPSFPYGNLGLVSTLWQGRLASNKSLKPTVTHVTPFAEKANPAPRYGGLVPPLGPTLRAALTAGDCTHPLVSLRERSLTIAWSRPECRQASLTPDWRLSRRPFYEQ